jgi:hypothetical protein
MDTEDFVDILTHFFFRAKRYQTRSSSPLNRSSHNRQVLSRRLPSRTFIHSNSVNHSIDNTPITSDNTHSLNEPRNSFQDEEVGIEKTPSLVPFVSPLSDLAPLNGSVNPFLTPSKLMCSVCLLEPVDIILIPCGHITACRICISQLELKGAKKDKSAGLNCPVCRQKVSGIFKFYISCLVDDE